VAIPSSNRQKSFYEPGTKSTSGPLRFIQVAECADDPDVAARCSRYWIECQARNSSSNAWLLAFMFFLSSDGGVISGLVHHLLTPGWSVAIRRFCGTFSTLPLSLDVVPVLADRHWGANHLSVGCGKPRNRSRAPGQTASVHQQPVFTSWPRFAFWCVCSIKALALLVASGRIKPALLCHDRMRFLSGIAFSCLL